MKNYFILCCVVIASFSARGNEPGSAVYVKLQKLHSLKRVLYVAAHPDDENTRALAWFSLGELAETAYFSLTRGDGGQNLIGNELGDELGVLRTQELLAARSHDKAAQYFSRAVDFGYSKSADESLSKWGKDAVLSDLVLMIRQFRPDVIITRFPPDERAGHGHHTASALLAIEALEKAADPEFLKDQVTEYGVWKAAAVYWNTSTWWVESIEESAKNNPDFLIADIGGYNPLLGMSYNEIGTIARSQHRCQGFGAIIERGSRMEYFQHLAGDRLENSFFEKSTTSWESLVNADFETRFQEVLTGFDFRNLQNNVPALMEILAKLEAMPASRFRSEKIRLCKEIITDCIGLYSELVGDDYAFVRGDSVSLHLNLINRSSLPVKLESVVLGKGNTVRMGKNLEENKDISEKITWVATSGQLSTPYWLRKPHGDLFSVERGDLLRAENRPVLEAEVRLLVDGKPFSFSIPAEYKWRDPAFGEYRRPLAAVPAFTADFEEPLMIAQPGVSREIHAKIHSFRNSLTDVIHVSPPTGWTVDKAEHKITIDRRHGEATISFVLTPGKEAPSGTLLLLDGAGIPLNGLEEIAYPHIPTQLIFQPAEMHCVSLKAEIVPGKIACINGVEDGIPKAIRQLGFEVDVYEVSDLPSVDLTAYRSVVLGIRIYNVHEELKDHDKQLFAYVEQGGNLIMQYNTAPRAADGATFGPLPFQLSRDRVTEENAAVRFLVPDHPILNVPNQITQKDFEGWVQERGLYFATAWNDQYVPLLGWADTGEKETEGALIALRFGKGQFVYTGISFFRELPAGVEGAFRLFANLLSYQP